MLQVLIPSRTRMRLLLRFFLNPGTTAYLRGLAEEFDESTNAIRVELNRFEEAGMIISENQGNKKIYKANTSYPLLQDIHNILLKHIGVDRIIDVVIKNMGQLESIHLCGDYAMGKDSGIIDLILVGDIDKEYLVSVVAKAEKLINRKIRFLTYEANEWNNKEENNHGRHLLLWENK
ncbi:MAG: ArsR family transcriptional regulator [Sphingobacteriales bacterium]|nr:MAG: ArsR family transcriptional regulator [Sphingobacteriales bacterium]